MNTHELEGWQGIVKQYAYTGIVVGLLAGIIAGVGLALDWTTLAASEVEQTAAPPMLCEFVPLVERKSGRSMGELAHCVDETTGTECWSRGNPAGAPGISCWPGGRGLDSRGILVPMK